MSHSRKRARSQTDDESDAGSLPAPVDARRCDSVYWFEDGNTILVAGDVDFRVHAGALTKRSPVLRELLSNPHPETADSIPVIQLFDHPTDIRRLLGAFIYGNDLRFITDGPDFQTLSSLLRMGHKYKLEHAVDAVLEYLQPYYPSRLTDWEAMRAGPPSFSALDHIGVVNIARLTDTPALLPVAFLHCCAVDPKVLRQGFTREDGTIETLSPDDLATVLMARAELMQQDVLDCLHILDVADDCDDSDECQRMLLTVHSEYIGARKWEQSFEAGWRQSWKAYLQKIDMVPCDECVEAIEEREREKLEELWDRWPTMLG
ncbi:hypothetical protein K466DRAFT_487650 [Polyporus arcularius HHB13444]|uniref:BTB domain-containing protein n=1 Tax=Polyporus arcularius HHB13444 TaxID=1314778 RepID=A0A5C3PH38_9APHY|nr:hypothetical protein K466DRAFT_487650 [Polyporus arcularius HHB13444]